MAAAAISAKDKDDKDVPGLVVPTQAAGSAGQRKPTDGAEADADTIAAAKWRAYLDTGRVVALSVLNGGVKMTYKPTARPYVQSSTRSVEVAVRYVESDPFAGRGRSIYIPRASLTPNGEWPLKQRDAEQTLGITCSALGKIYVTDSGAGEA